MKLIIEAYGRMAVIVIIVLALMVIIFNTNEKGELVWYEGFNNLFANETTDLNGDEIDNALLKYSDLQKKQQIRITEKLSANARYLIYEFVSINGSCGQFSEEGKERFVKISKLINTNGDDVVEGVFDVSSRNVVFTVPGIYKAYLVITDENDVHSEGWYVIQVIASNGVCPNASDGIHKYCTEEKGATCITNGYKLHTCSFCGDTYRDGTVAKSGHSYMDKILTPVSCTSGGLVRHTCTLCGFIEDEKLEALGHDMPTEKTNATYICSQVSTNSMVFTNAGLFGYVVASYDFRDVCPGCGATNYHYWMLTSLNYIFTTGTDLGGTPHCSHYFCKRCGANVDKLM